MGEHGEGGFFRAFRTRLGLCAGIHKVHTVIMKYAIPLHTILYPRARLGVHTGERLLYCIDHCIPGKNDNDCV